MRTTYFLTIGIDREYGYEEEEFFFYGNDLGDIFHEIMSTVRYYASTKNYADAWSAEARLYNEDAGTYLCNIVATSYNPGISVFRDEWEMENAA